MQKIRDASGEVSSIETGEKNLKMAKAIGFTVFLDFMFSHDVKTAFAGLPNTALHLNPAGKEVMEYTGHLLDRILNQNLMN